MRKPNRLVGILAFTVFAASSAFADEVTLGPAEGKLQLSQISSLLAGRYDNEPQIYYLEGMKRGSTAPARLHLEIRASNEKTDIFEIEERDGSEHASIARRGALTLEMDPTTRHVIMRLTGDGSRCEWIWKWRNSVWMAQPRGECAGDKTGRGLPGKTLWLGKDELWLEAPGQPVIVELGRAHQYECYIALRPRGGKPNIFTGLRIHDRGGTLDVMTNESPARKLTLSLRRGMWPSNSGNNLVELLSLYLREEGQPTLLGSGWATPDSPRVGFGTEEEEVAEPKTINSRCKRID